MRRLLPVGFSLVFAAAVQAEPTRLFWGDTHLHTSFSPDAFFFGNRDATPDVAYRYAKGLPIVDPGSRARVQIDTPLDFLVIADHAEMMGVPYGLYQGDAMMTGTLEGKRFLDMLKAGEAEQVFKEFIQSLNANRAIDSLNTDRIRRSVWQRSNAIAEQYNEPGKFTTFIGWEWTSTPGGNNLHRVVFMPDGANKSGQFIPYSSLDSDKPEQLWQWLDNTAKTVNTDFVAIPHNSNISGGLMFSRQDSEGRPITADYARTRMRWEPVVEATQIKGDSETHPLFSPDDEFADFETYSFMIDAEATEANERVGRGDYVRTALLDGMAMETAIGVNPYKFALIGSSDAHTSRAGAEEDNFGGKAPLASTPETLDYKGIGGVTGWDMAASGLAAVWAEENTRESLFAAFKRREVYATSGPRIALRFFGGWEFKASDAEARDLARRGYGKGVPMGGELTSAPRKKSPSFLIEAVKDTVGANLDRIQVVKGYLDADGKPQEKIYNVALSGGRKVARDGRVLPVGNTVDLTTGRYTNSIGDSRLTVVWSDPDFDPTQRAFYYARVLQIPTPRHTFYDELALQQQKKTPDFIQERAYGSPIWYTP